MSQIKDLRNVYLTLLIGAVIIVVGAILFNQVRYVSDQQTELSPAPSASVSPSPTTVGNVVQPVDLTSPTPSPSAVVTATMPQSVSTFLANFYAAYTQEDRSRLATYFTPDTSDADRSSHAHLFTNMDTAGNPGGPYLFTDAAANEHAIGYSVINGSSLGSNWIVTVLEQRVDSTGLARDAVTTLLTLVPSTNPLGSWLVDNYIYSGGVGKYSAFLNQ